MIYFDNAATSYPKPKSVLNAVGNCMKNYCANPGRSGHGLALKSNKKIYETRERAAGFFGIKNPLRLCFFKNATEGINTALHGYVSYGMHIITTMMEHNSVIRPLKMLEKNKAASISFLKGDQNGRVTLDDIKKAVNSNTGLIALTLSSNVNGVIMPAEEIGKFCRNTGIAFMLDASQGGGSLKIDVGDMNIDILALSGHKGLMGPQGTGLLYVGDGIKINPLMQGGTGSVSKMEYQPDFYPDMLESGTLNTPGIAGLNEGIRFIMNTGLDNIHNKKMKLLKIFKEGIKNIKGIKTYSPKDIRLNSGILAINIKDMDSVNAAQILWEKYNIAVRAGFHCAPFAHKLLNTNMQGIIRFSFSYFNTEKEVHLAVKALKSIAALYT